MPAHTPAPMQHPRAGHAVLAPATSPGRRSSSVTAAGFRIQACRRFDFQPRLIAAPAGPHPQPRDPRMSRQSPFRAQKLAAAPMQNWLFTAQGPAVGPCCAAAQEAQDLCPATRGVLVLSRAQSASDRGKSRRACRGRRKGDNNARGVRKAHSGRDSYGYPRPDSCRGFCRNRDRAGVRPARRDVCPDDGVRWHAQPRHAPGVLWMGPGTQVLNSDITALSGLSDRCRGPSRPS